MPIEKIGKTGIVMTGPLRVRTDKEKLDYIIIQYALQDVLIKRLERKVEKLEKKK